VFEEALGPDDERELVEAEDAPNLLVRGQRVGRAEMRRQHRPEHLLRVARPDRERLLAVVVVEREAAAPAPLGEFEAVETVVVRPDGLVAEEAVTPVDERPSGGDEDAVVAADTDRRQHRLAVQRVGHEVRDIHVLAFHGFGINPGVTPARRRPAPEEERSRGRPGYAVVRPGGLVGHSAALIG